MENLKNGKPKIVAQDKADNINYDYPSCGGVEVSVRLMSDGRCYARQGQYSNYDGETTNLIHMADITGTRCHALMLAWANDLLAPDGEPYESPAEYRIDTIINSEDGVRTGSIRCLSRGYRVS
jgi:hypothetical protein